MPPSVYYTSFGILYFLRYFRSAIGIFMSNRYFYSNRHFYVQSAFLCPIGIMFDLRAFCNQSATDDTSMHGCAPIVECMACDSGMCYTGVRACRRVCVCVCCLCVCVCVCVRMYVCLPCPARAPPRAHFPELLFRDCRLVHEGRRGAAFACRRRVCVCVCVVCVCVCVCVVCVCG